MPKSKKPRRKPQPLKNKIPRLPLHQIDPYTFGIRPKEFDRLREDQDFINLIRVGRLLNALTYMMGVAMDSNIGNSPTDRKRFWRNIFNTGGYLYEGYLLIESISLKYVDERPFDSFRKILETLNPRRKKILREMRDNAAFHLDHENKSTIKAIKALKLPRYALVSAENSEMGSLYFDLADTADWNYLIDQCKTEVNKDEGSIKNEILQVVVELNAEFARASEKFVRGIAVRLKLLRQDAFPEAPERSDSQPEGKQYLEC